MEAREGETGKQGESTVTVQANISAGQAQVYQDRVIVLTRTHTYSAKGSSGTDRIRRQGAPLLTASSVMQYLETVKQGTGKHGHVD